MAVSLGRSVPRNQQGSRLAQSCPACKPAHHGGQRHGGAPGDADWGIPQPGLGVGCAGGGGGSGCW